MSYYIEKFVPFKFAKFDLNKIELDKLLGKKMHYASCGKAALYHCLLSLGLKPNDKVLVPNYICSSVLIPIRKLGLMPIYYDINDSDLNAQLDSIIVNVESNVKIKAVLVASMYGNPANLPAIERYCREKHVFLIDDAAQSMGAMIDDRYVGTFGDAGFFSFSPGKATPGHLGAFYWTSNNDYWVCEKNHYIYHKIVYLSYYFNRYNKYNKYSFLLSSFFKSLELLLKRFVDSWNDRMNSFERYILGGILHENLIQTFRKEYSSKFFKVFNNNKLFKVVTKGEDNTNNHKLVILCNSKEIASSLINHLDKQRISTLNGYPLLERNAKTPNAINVERRVIEIPLENDPDKFDYIIQSISFFTKDSL